MRRGLLAVLLMSACAPEKTREFELGLIGPVGPGVAASARAAGLTVRDAAPPGAETLSAAAVFTGPGGRAEERMDDWRRLRLLSASAAARGRTGVFFVLPKTADGRELTGYPEEWQALARTALELSSMRPVLERGAEAEVPFAVPAGVEARAWRHQGRLYALLVNPTEVAVPLPPEPLDPWRALFEARADARELLIPCPGGRCLEAGRVLWLEGRL